MFENKKLKEASTTIDILQQEIASLEKQNKELRGLAEKRTIVNEDFYTYIDNNLYEWQKVFDLVRLLPFKSLCRFIAIEMEKQEQEITVPTEMHKFWHIQGAKSVLHTLLTFEGQAKKQMEFIASGGKSEKKEAVESPTVDYQS